MVTVIANPKKELCDKEVAKVIAKSIHKILQTKDTVVLGIVGGRSVSGIFQALRTKPVPWGHIHIFVVDEGITRDNQNSNFQLAKKDFLDELIKKGILPKENIHPFLIEKGIKQYQQELQKYGGVYDIILLSSGEDGHVGALFPNYSVKDKGEFFVPMKDAPKPPKERMSASLHLLKKSKVAIVLFYGEAKREAYDQFNNDEVSIIDCPAKLVLEIKESFAVTDLE